MRRIPPVVFEHFRAPRNERVLRPADAVGEIEGRFEDSRIRLYLRETRRGLRAGFSLEGDRSAVAALSLLTSRLNGASRAEAEAWTIESLAASYGLDEELYPMLLPALDALAAALADLRGEPNPFAADGEQLCHCLNVRRGRLLRLARERDLRSLEAVRHWTGACSGCRSCRQEVEELLAELWGRGSA
ncbi:MAG: hypothetical protein D6731_11550 [Planctomycetota bacterium]|nr:MAG: hypothetical protein D6731_11550 [Planctomycetota bacterium]